MFKKTKFQVMALLVISILAIGGCARKTPERLLSDAQDATKQYDFTLAITKLEQFLELYPHDPRAARVQFQIGALHMNMGQYNLAIQEFQKVIQKYPAAGEGDTQAKFAIANCYVQETAMDKAMDIWTQISTDTTHPIDVLESKMNMARAYEIQKKWPNAEKEYREVIASFPLPKNLVRPEASEKGVVDATQQLALVLYREGKVDKAIDLYKSIQTMYPNNEYVQGVAIWSNVIIGDIYTLQKQPKKAADSYQKALASYAKITSDKLLPDKACWAMTKMGEIYELHMNDTTKAVSLYKEATTDFAKSQSAMFAKRALMRVSRPPMARDTTKMNLPVSPVETTKKK